MINTLLLMSACLFQKDNSCSEFEFIFCSITSYVPEKQKSSPAKRPDCLVTELLLCSVWKQCDLTGAFNRNRQSTLILCRSSCYTAWQNFTALADELLEQVCIFIVNVSNFVHSEETNFTTLIAAAAACRSFVVVSAFSLLKSHALSVLSLLKWQIIIRNIDWLSFIGERILIVG